MKNQESQVSRLFFWGFEGVEVTPGIRKFLKRFPPAGLILFKRNIGSPSQVKRLVSDLQKAASSPLLIGIDEEGGRVRRLPESFMHYPPAAEWGKIWEKGESKIVRAGYEMAKKLRSLGINADFAPVLDVHSNPKNPIIGDRAFSKDPEIAGKAATAFYLGMKKAKIIACGKHFPGHGDTTADSHLTLPKVSRDRKTLERVELAPFREAIRKKIPMLMTAHVVYKAWDPKNPATFSSIILKNILRKKLGFKGVVISDDLQMKAVSKKYSEAESSILSLEAGVDILLICSQMEALGESVISTMEKALKKSVALQKRFMESFARLLKLRSQYPLR
jgi:beta-N-acetylhexosaminidase